MAYLTRVLYADSRLQLSRLLELHLASEPTHTLVSFEYVPPGRPSSESALGPLALVVVTRKDDPADGC